MRTTIRPVSKLANPRTQVASATAATAIDPAIATSVVTKCHQLNDRCSVANSRLEINNSRSSDFSFARDLCEYERPVRRFDSRVANSEGLQGATKCVLFRHRHQDNAAGRNQRLDSVLAIPCSVSSLSFPAPSTTAEAMDSIESSAPLAKCYCLNSVISQGKNR